MCVLSVMIGMEVSVELTSVLKSFTEILIMKACKFLHPFYNSPNDGHLMHMIKIGLSLVSKLTLTDFISHHCNIGAETASTEEDSEEANEQLRDYFDATDCDALCSSHGGDINSVHRKQKLLCGKHRNIQVNTVLLQQQALGDLI